MKLTKEQLQEIKDQQSQENKTKRVTAPELEKSKKTRTIFNSKGLKETF